VEQTFIDISVPLENGVVSDPPGYLPKIDYIDHQMSLGELRGFFPGLRDEDLPDEEAWAIERIQLITHNGTHLDAPIHFPPGTTTVDQIPAKQLFGPAVVVDVRAEGAKDADYQLPAARVEEWEKAHGRIAEGSIVLLRTGWASRWPDAQKYRNQDAQGRMHFPGFSAEAVRLLIQRKISGIGCDTMSADYGASQDFAVHHLALGAGLYHLENLADLSAVQRANVRHEGMYEEQFED